MYCRSEQVHMYIIVCNFEILNFTYFLSLIYTLHTTIRISIILMPIIKILLIMFTDNLNIFISVVNLLIILHTLYVGNWMHIINLVFTRRFSSTIILLRNSTLGTTKLKSSKSSGTCKTTFW